MALTRGVNSGWPALSILKTRVRPISWLLLAGLNLALPVGAQKQITETAPGQVLPGTTPGLTSSVPSVVRGGNFLDRIYRPTSSFGSDFSGPPAVGSFSAPSGGAALDPAARQRLIDARDRRKNWAIDGYARANRGEVDSDTSRRETPKGAPAESARSANRADLMLQAVDPEYARRVGQRDPSGLDKPANKTEAAIESANQRAERLRRGENLNDSQDGRDSRRSRDSRDPNDVQDSSEAGSLARTGEDFTGRELRESDRSGASPSGAGAGVSERSFRGDESGARASDFLPSQSRPDATSIRLETLRQERESELTSLLSGSEGFGGGLGKGEMDFGLSKGDRAQEFKRMLSTDEPSVGRPGGFLAPTGVAASSAVGASVGGFAAEKPFGGASALPNRDLPSFGGSTSANLISAPASTLSKGPPPLTARPAQLPIPMRGQF